MGYVGLGAITTSPGLIVANARWDSPSLAPMVTTASVSGSRSTLYLRLYQSTIATLSFVIPLDAEYLWFFGFLAASVSLSTTWGGLARSGFPIPRSIMSSPRRLASIFIEVTMLKT